MSNQHAAKRIFSGTVWGILARILDAGAKFVTIPLLVGYYGKADYGLIALAFSLNAYLRLMDLGMNVGSVRFLAIWESAKDWTSISRASRSSVLFYGTIGLINSLIFICMGHEGEWLFNLSKDQIPIYRVMMYILAGSTVLNWLSNVIIQLLSAKDELGYVNRVSVISSLLNFAVALAAIQLHWSLPLYFLFYTLSTLVPIPFHVYKLRVFPIPLGALLNPKWDGKIFREILGYSAAIFLMGLFQLTANELRPILLARYARGMDVLTDYRVIQTIAMLVISFGTVFLQVMLPAASKVYATQDQQQMEKMVFEGTRFISVFLTGVVFVLVLNSDSILMLYMGEEYLHLTKWLNIWLFTVLLNMHNTPVASLVLSSGKTRFLIYSSAVACIVSLPITVVLAPSLDVGAAVLGYLVYMSIQIGFFYVYYIPQVLKLSSSRILFGAFGPAILCGVASFAVAFLAKNLLPSLGDFLNILLVSVVFFVVFGLLLRVFVVDKDDIIRIRGFFEKPEPPAFP